MFADIGSKIIKLMRNKQVRIEEHRLAETNNLSSRAQRSRSLSLKSSHFYDTCSYKVAPFSFK